MIAFLLAMLVLTTGVVIITVDAKYKIFPRKEFDYY